MSLRRYLLDDEPARMALGWLAELAAGREVPDYGSAEWLRADRSLQIASALRAAEAWRRECLLLSVALADELEAGDWLEDQREAAEFVEVARMVQAMGRPGHRSHAELAAARREVVRSGRAA